MNTYEKEKIKINDSNLTSITEELTQEQWMLILWSFVTDLPIKEWNEFAYDLIYKNRFSSSHKIVDVVKEFSGRCTSVIEKGKKLFRARIYYQDPLQEFLSDVFEDAMLEKSFGNNESINDYYGMQLAAMVMEVEKETSRGRKIVDVYNKWKRKRFKGYNSAGSGVPPIDKVTSGRFNPERIRYFYLAEDSQTAVYEVRPTIGQYVSVATFKTEKDLKIYDFAEEINTREEKDRDGDYSLLNVVQQRFSEPNTGDALMYLPIQYLGEMIKQMGFDGIRFRSSLKSGGVNIVLFDDNSCKAICSDIIKVGDIELKFDNPEIYQLEEYICLDKKS